MCRRRQRGSIRTANVPFETALVKDFKNISLSTERTYRGDSGAILKIFLVARILIRIKKVLVVDEVEDKSAKRASSTSEQLVY